MVQGSNGFGTLCFHGVSDFSILPKKTKSNGRVADDQLSAAIPRIQFMAAHGPINGVLGSYSRCGHGALQHRLAEEHSGRRGEVEGVASGEGGSDPRQVWEPIEAQIGYRLKIRYGWP